MKSSVRLYVLLARQAAVGVVFRRGPSGQVQLVRWCTETDRFFPGQWLKGRIYERRCDLSPSGERLVYFAANYRPPLRSWTAISRPPYLTALALWPKGDGWGGGGLFASENEILLNHRPGEMSLAKGFFLPPDFKVSPFGERPGGGEDDPILSHRLLRDGWQFIQKGEVIEHPFRAPLRYEMKPPIIWEKNCPIGDNPWSLQMIWHGIGERDGPWYVMEYTLANRLLRKTVAFGRADWADWDHTGDVLFAKDGCLFRLAVSSERVAPALEKVHRLIDLSQDTFRPLECPEEAKDWFAPLKLKDKS